eukprot:CAMPEP_0206479482 /NCGR_PEP_ID=MMETSP0324_2-20121206/36697_1 /ASSEMBLY_ACC=CAM_ASM_000836 /TAXON_ID=2866 /ORGANISM="Crypthecodinium cohnii, Strain Seligo" /LENGTH=59 /DNA_ID=CAMNT_0053956031 /DNA_START=290 /DNA_END=470 /DNA_ORIENTATION=-
MSAPAPDLGEEAVAQLVATSSGELEDSKISGSRSTHFPHRPGLYALFENLEDCCLFPYG